MQLAVFDLDGTVTRRDTLFPYIAGFLQRRPWRWAGLWRVVPTVLSFATGKADHGRLKSALIKSTLGGCRRAELSDWTERFVRELLEDGLFLEARNQIADHRRSGDRLVLMSASIDLYVPAVARALGFDEVICTGIRWDADRLQGDLTTPNRRGAEKARCLRQLRERFPQLPIVAYANAASDLEHLQLAQQGFLVNGSASARAKAPSVGVANVVWR